MSIQDYMQTDFTISTRSETKVGGRNVMSYTPEGNTYRCAIFTPSISKTVRFGKQDFIISKNLYCNLGTPIKLGDIIIIGGGNYDVISLLDTNNIGHHLALGLIERES